MNSDELSLHLILVILPATEGPTNQQINLLYSIRQLPIYLKHTLITIYNYVNTILAIFYKDYILISDNFKKFYVTGTVFLDIRK